MLESSAILEFDVQKIFTETTLGNYYPLTILTFALDSSVCGKNPLCFHLTSFLFHFLNAALVFLLISLVIKRGALIALIGSAFFALHPVNVEAVSWIASRNQVVSTFFLLLFLITYWSSNNSQSRQRFALLTISLFFFIAALLSRPSVVAALAVIPIIDWLQRSLSLKRCFEKILFAVPAFLIMKTTLEVRVTGEVPTPEIFELSLLERTLVAGQSFVFYVSRAIYPRNLRAYYDFLSFQLDVWDYILFGGLVVAGAGYYIKSNSHDRRILFFATALFSAMLLPTIKIIPFGEYSLVHDRYLYASLIGFSLLISGLTSALIDLNLNAKRALFIGWSIAILALIVTTHQRTKNWDGSEKLWTHVLTHEPHSTVPLNNLGVIFLKSGNVINAKPLFEKALESRPRFAIAYFNLGEVELENGNTAKAESHYLTAVHLRPQYSEAHTNLGFLYSKFDDKLGLARTHFQKALDAGSDYPEALFNLATVEAKLGQYSLALIRADEVRRKWPSFMRAHLLAGEIYLLQGQREKAVAALKIAAASESDVREIALKRLRDHQLIIE